MNSPLRRNTCENAINKEPTRSTVAAKSKPEPKTPVVSYDYEAIIRQPDISICSKVDNKTQNASWSEPSDELSAPVKKKNLYVRGKASVITKKRGIVCKSKIQAKKVTKTYPPICNAAEIKKESITPSEIIRDVENYRKESSDGVTMNCQTPPNQDLVHIRDIQIMSGIVKNDKSLVREAADVIQNNSVKNDKHKKSCTSQNKVSKIPRKKPSIKPDSFLPKYGESRVYPSAKLPVGNKLKYCTERKSPADNEKEKLMSENLWYPEKSSEIDADEEFEGDMPTPTKESRIITSAGDDPRSVTLLKSLALKCECRSCNDHKYASTVHTDQCTETECWSSPGIGSTRKWKSMSHRKFVDMSSEDLDSSDYNVINYSNGKTNKKTNRPNLANHITKSSQIINHTKMKTYPTTSFTFFNVFFDIVFWPFVFLRAKQ